MACDKFYQEILFNLFHLGGLRGKLSQVRKHSMSILEKE